jgi:hypothetical protein
VRNQKLFTYRETTICVRLSVYGVFIFHTAFSFNLKNTSNTNTKVKIRIPTVSFISDSKVLILNICNYLSQIRHIVVFL